MWCLFGCLPCFFSVACFACFLAFIVGLNSVVVAALHVFPYYHNSFLHLFLNELEVDRWGGLLTCPFGMAPLQGAVLYSPISLTHEFLPQGLHSIRLGHTTSFYRAVSQIFTMSLSAGFDGCRALRDNTSNKAKIATRYWKRLKGVADAEGEWEFLDKS